MAAETENEYYDRLAAERAEREDAELELESAACDRYSEGDDYVDRALLRAEFGLPPLIG